MFQYLKCFISLGDFNFIKIYVTNDILFSNLQFIL